MNRRIESDISYYIFILGYDLLHDLLSINGNYSCDYAYDICNKIALDFKKSGYLDNLKWSEYECLEHYVRDNKGKLERL